MIRSMYSYLFAAALLAAPVCPTLILATDQSPHEAIEQKRLELDTAFQHFDRSLYKAKHTSAETLLFTEKYGQNIDINNVCTKIIAASSTFNQFMETKIKSIQPYLQQDPVIISTDEYQDIYSTLDLIIRANIECIKKLTAYVESNFSTEFNVDFLTSQNDISLDKRNVTTSTCIAHCTELHAAAEKLSTANNNIGISRWDRAKRLCYKYIIKPWYRYEIGTRLFFGSLAAVALGSLYWEKYCKGEIDPTANWFTQLLRNKLGTPPTTAKSNVPVYMLAGFGIAGATMDRYHFPSETEQWWDESCKDHTTEWNYFDFMPWFDFSSVIGLDDMKAYFKSMLTYVEDPVTYAGISDHIITQYVFHGESGTGKSFFAETLAGEMKKHNPNIRIFKIHETLLNEATFYIIDWIRNVNVDPCVIIIENVHTFKKSSHDKLKIFTSFAMNQSSNKPVFMFFTSNNLEPFDDKLAHLGIQCKFIKCTKPSYDDRFKFITHRLKMCAQDPKHFDIATLAQHTEEMGFFAIRSAIDYAEPQSRLDNVPLSTEYIIKKLGFNNV